jgi:dihydroxyacetone kinase
MLTKDALSSGLKRLIAAEPDITKYDTMVGDGDCGIGLKRGAEGVLGMLSGSELSDDAVVMVGRISRIVEKDMDGTSGAIYAIFLNSLTHSLRELSKPNVSASPEVWAIALERSLESLGKYTPARPGDRTLVDALQPFIATLSSTRNVKKAAAASREGAERTIGMEASLGRTVYVGGHSWRDVPDPGAWGLSEFLLGLADGIDGR